MTRKFNISLIKKILLLAVGFNVAFFAHTPRGQEIGDPDSAWFEDGMQEEESKESRGGELLVAYEAIVMPLVQYHVDHTLSFVLDLFLIEDDPVQTKPERRIIFNNYFKVLFCQIISPNAP